MKILQLIKSRRSIRKFRKEPIPLKVIDGILEAGSWAPSGLNNQPWRFIVLEKDEKDAIAQFTKYGQIIKAADKIILVFMDKDASYSYEKDLMAIGACIQNMLLYAHQEGIGSCWLGEILNQRKDLLKHLGILENLELEAVIALGYPAEKGGKAERLTLKKLMIK